jgi:dihydrofolate reductase
MRKLIAGFKVSADGKIEGPEGFADWVDAWSEDYGLTKQIDACLLGAHMYVGYEQYWTAIQQHEPGTPLPMTGKIPTLAEVEWAHFAKQTPHYVLSNSLTSAAWPNTRFVKGVDEIAALKNQPGKDIYLMGGAQIATSLMDVGMVDELHLIVYPLIAGEGTALFANTKQRQMLELKKVQQRQNGLISLIYNKKLNYK